MKTFAEVITENPPRLVVLFQYGGDGTEQFQWGVVGKIPLLSMVAHIVAVQRDLCDGEWIPECNHEPPALALVWDGAERSFQSFLHPLVPRAPLVGMLETIKAALVESRVGRHAAAQKVQLLGPDGQPYRG